MEAVIPFPVPMISYHNPFAVDWTPGPQLPIGATCERCVELVTLIIPSSPASENESEDAVLHSTLGGVAASNFRAPPGCSVSVKSPTIASPLSSTPPCTYIKYVSSTIVVQKAVSVVLAVTQDKLPQSFPEYTYTLAPAKSETCTCVNPAPVAVNVYHTPTAFSGMTGIPSHKGRSGSVVF